MLTMAWLVYEVVLKYILKLCEHRFIRSKDQNSVVIA